MEHIELNINAFQYSVKINYSIPSHFPNLSVNPCFENCFGKCFENPFVRFSMKDIDKRINVFPWKKVKFFIWKHLNPLCLRMLCAKFGWNCSFGEGDENVKSLQTFWQATPNHSLTSNTQSEKFSWGFNSG